VIHGVGGVGKTRLMLELGNIALDMGIQVIRVTRQKASLSELVASLERTGNYVILFDYIEESETYFIQELQQIQQEGLRLFPIANCRESYLPSNRIDHNPKNTYFIQFEADAELEAQFEDFVVQTILEGIQGFDFDQSLFQLRPAFAVFLYYLNATGKINAHDLADFADFNSWVARRLSLTLQKESINKIPRKVFHFMACLPAPNTQIQSFRADTELDLAFVNLEKDGWIDTELDGEGFATIVHDVLKDEALLQFHHYNGSKIARELENSLKFALAHNAFSSWAWSYERILGRGGVTDSISGAVIAKQLAANPAAFDGHDWILAATTLLSQADKFKLYATEAGFFQQYTASWPFGYVLSHEIKRLKKASQEAAFPEMAGMLARWLAAHPSFYNNPKLSSYVLCAWLDAKADPSTIKEFVLAYLKQHAASPEAQFVYKAWLDAKAEPSTIKEFVLAYLKQHAASPEAQFVYKAWLDAKADPSTIKEFVLAYLRQHETSPEVRFILSTWLDAKADPSTVKEFVLAYLKQHAVSPEAPFVYAAWLNAKANPSTIKEFVLAYLKQHAASPEAPFVYAAWLNAKADPSTIKEFVLAYLEQHAASPEAQFVYAAWLNAKADPSTIREFVLDFLEQHAASLEARFVYKAWLNAKGDPSTIKGFVLTYLGQHAASSEASFVYPAWLDAKADPITVKEFVLAYLKQHAASPEARFVYKAWLDAKGDPSNVKEFVLAYLKNPKGPVETPDPGVSPPPRKPQQPPL
jgi:urease accessory protein UreF